MQVARILDGVRDWCKEAICSKVTLKLPDDRANDASYEPVYVNPQAFVMYLPAKDRHPPSIPAPIPSLTVQLMEGDDTLLTRMRRLKIRLNIATWNPGEHGREILIPHKDETQMGGHFYRKWSGPDAEAHYRRSTEGWRDAWNFTDTALNAVENTEFFADTRLVKELGVSFGPFTEDGVIWEYYPYWHSWITFTLECGIALRPPEAYSHLL